ncbi:MAG: tetratricopeptide repeat protein, partial [Chitinophagales bacterium]|nr:tetratricopeptide repeat protein [Chitinophagales bacterium]
YRMYLKNVAWDTSAIFYLANSLFFQKNFSDAAYEYERLLEIDKKRADVYNLAGVCYRNINNLTKAKDYFKLAIISDSTMGIAYYNLGSIQYALEDYVHAAQNLEKASILLPNEQEILSLLGKVYLETGQKEKALNTFEGLYALNNQSERTNVMLAQLYFEAKDYNKAVFHFNKAFSTVNNNPELIAMLGMAYFFKKDYAMSYQLLSKASQTLTERKDVLTMTAAAANMLKKYDEAADYASRALALDKNYSPAIEELAKSLKGRKKKSAAKKLLKQSNQLKL